MGWEGLHILGLVRQIVDSMHLHSCKAYRAAMPIPCRPSILHRRDKIGPHCIALVCRGRRSAGSGGGSGSVRSGWLRRPVGSESLVLRLRPLLRHLRHRLLLLLMLLVLRCCFYYLYYFCVFCCLYFIGSCCFCCFYFVVSCCFCWQRGRLDD